MISYIICKCTSSSNQSKYLDRRSVITLLFTSVQYVLKIWEHNLIENF